MVSTVHLCIDTWSIEFSPETWLLETLGFGLMVILGCNFIFDIKEYVADDCNQNCNISTTEPN